VLCCCQWAWGWAGNELLKEFSSYPLITRSFNLESSCRSDSSFQPSTLLCAPTLHDTQGVTHKFDSSVCFSAHAWVVLGISLSLLLWHQIWFSKIPVEVTIMSYPSTFPTSSGKFCSNTLDFAWWSKDFWSESLLNVCACSFSQVKWRFQIPVMLWVK
jgi:hypothetical protein